MDVINAILKPVAETLMVPVKKHLGYTVSCTKFLRDMDIKMRELEAARIGVEDHMKRNKLKKLEIPSEVYGWLQEVGDIKKYVEKTPTDVGCCFNLKIKHKVGKEAFKIIEEIESLKRKHSLINWFDDRIPLGKVDSMKASTSTPSTDHHDFESRKMTFTKALRALEQNHKSHMIALCGIAGVGKTTMMQDLKKVVKEKRMFSFVVEVVIGVKTDPIAVQQAVADYLTITLEEKTKAARAERLRKSFEEQSDGGKNRILVILDDVWDLFDLNDIGLSPNLPNQEVGIKVLLTSRNRDVCSRMGVKADSMYDVKVLTNPEAQRLFRQCIKDSDDADLDHAFREIGDDITSRCGGLPIAIKTMAYNLRGQSKEVWNNSLSCLKHGDVDEIVHDVFEMSYQKLKNETRSIFLLCGLYPQGFNIPREDLVRYGWGLKLFHKVYTIREARDRLNTCVEQLIHANLLIRTRVAWVKMHDLVHAFVLSKFSKGEHASIVNHGNMVEWPAKDTCNSCQRLSLTCNSMSEFPPEYIKYPNLTLLRLMHGDNLLRHSQDFYDGMENLQVIAYARTHYPFSRSLQCSTTLRTLCLEDCSLMFDYSFIGNLQNLEVLSFANSGIRKLPSTFGNLNKLKLLDVTGCVNLHIDNGVLKNLVKLEELYMRVANSHDKKAISFTDGSCNDFEECSKNLFTLEAEFFEHNAQLKNMSFKKLERFNISIGCFSMSTGENLLPFENKMMLVTSKSELLGSRVNELFVKTNVLYLQVSDMNDLEEIHVDVESLHSPKQQLFSNLRFLSVSHCRELKYLFTASVASSLSNLEDLRIGSCPIMETLIHEENRASQTIRFPKLNCLFLGDLPKLSSLCHTTNVVELPELVVLELDFLPKITSIYPRNRLATSFMPSSNSMARPLLKEEVVIPKLEKLYIFRMGNLEEIWSSSDSVNMSLLREIRVMSCYSLTCLFPKNPMPLLCYLEDLVVEDCHSIEVLFNLDFGCFSEIEGKSSLRRIVVSHLKKLKEVWRVKGVGNSNLPIHGFQALESLKIEDCRCFRNLFTPTTASFDLAALTSISMEKLGRNYELADISQEQQMFARSKEKTVNVIDNIPNVALMLTFHHLHTLYLSRCKGREVMFELGIAGAESSRESGNNQQSQLLPYLRNLDLRGIEEMSHVWKCSNWNKLIILQQSQSQPKSSFHNLTMITLYQCKSIKYLFSPLTLKLFINLKEVIIQFCDGIEEVVSSRDDQDDNMTYTSISTDTRSIFSPLLEKFELWSLESLWHIGGGGGPRRTAISSNNSIAATSIDHEFQRHTQVGVALWSLCQYSRRIEVSHCKALSSLIPYHAARHMQNLEELVVDSCDSMTEVFETEIANNTTSTYTSESSGNVGTSQKFPNMIVVPQLCNLKILVINGCGRVRDLFIFSTLESLKQLRQLEIEDCKNIQVIVKEEDGADTSKIVVFPYLKSVKLLNLPNLKGFFLGMNEFRWDLLEVVEIKGCPKMRRFTHGHSTSQMLKYVHIGFGKYSPKYGLNFHMTNELQETSISSLDGSNSTPTLETTPSPFPDLIEIENDTPWIKVGDGMRNSVPYYELHQLEKLEKLRLWGLDHVEDHVEYLLEALRTNSGSNEPLSVRKFPNLRELELGLLQRLKFIWKSNQWTVLEFPNLTKLSIHKCKSLGHVFTCSMVGSLVHLQELKVSHCSTMKAIVKEEDEKECNVKLNEIIFPSLKSIKLERLSHLQGFCLGGQDFQWPSLLTLEINYCPSLKVFTNGNSIAPKLKLIDTDFGIFDAKEDPNTLIRIQKTRGTLTGEPHEDESCSI